MLAKSSGSEIGESQRKGRRIGKEISNHYFSQLSFHLFDLPFLLTQKTGTVGVLHNRPNFTNFLNNLSSKMSPSVAV